MLLRYRWYRLSVPGGALETAIDSWASPENDGVFMRAELFDGQNGFRFYWESQITINRIGPAGAVQREQVSSTSLAEFVLLPVGKNRALLCLVEPGRNVRPLMAALERVYGLGFSCAPITLEKNPPLSILDHVDDARLVGLKLCNVIVKKSIVARMEFAAKSGMHESDLGRISKLKQTRDQAVYDLVYKGVRGHLSYTSSGLVRVGGALAPRILNYVERDVRRLAQRTGDGSLDR